MTELSFQVHIIISCKQTQISEGRKKGHPVKSIELTQQVPPAKEYFIGLHLNASPPLHRLCLDELFEVPLSSGRLLRVNLNDRRCESAPNIAGVVDPLCVSSSLWCGGVTG